MIQLTRRSAWSLALAGLLLSGCASGPKPANPEAGSAPSEVAAEPAPEPTREAAPAPAPKPAPEPAEVPAPEPLPAPAAAPASPEPARDGPRFVLLDTSKGKIVLELDPAKAPISVANFMEYVKSGFYDGTVFHRVVPNFVVQGGGFDGQMAQKQTRPAIKNEWTNGLKNLKGTISMARLPMPDSATSQFFLNLKDNAMLDGANGPGYAVFGKIVAGMDVLDAMGGVRTGKAQATDQGGISRVFTDVPAEPLTLTKASEIPAEEAAKLVGAENAAAPAPAPAPAPVPAPAPAAPAGN